MNTIEQLDILIANQKRAIRLYLILSSFVFCLGLILLICMLAIGKAIAPEPMKTILSIAGGFISSISLIPLKELIACMDKFNVYRNLRIQAERGSKIDKKRIESLIWEALKKISIG